MSATSVVDDTQLRAARVVGLSYLLAILPALFSGIYIASHLAGNANPATAAQWIISHQRLFRVGIASDLVAFTIDIALVTALYAVLKPVNKSLALFAAFCRVIETALFFAVTLRYFDMLGFLSGADYLRGFEADHLQALARLAFSAHNSGYNVGLVLAGLGSTVFCYLWLESGYIPKVLAGFGIFASAVLAACTFTYVVFPEYAKIVTVAFYGGPIFLFELTMGFWLLFKGLRSD